MAWQTVVGLYCNHKVIQWRPWGAGHMVLQAARVDHIPINTVLATIEYGDTA